MLYYVIHTGLLVLVLVHVCIPVTIPRELLAIRCGMPYPGISGMPYPPPLVIHPALRHSQLARLAPLEEVSICLPIGACLNEPHCFRFWGMLRQAASCANVVKPAEDSKYIHS